MIELHSIYKSYQLGELAVPVLKNINITVEKGEYVSIMGPSGSGKYILNGRDVSEEDDVKLAAVRKRTIGFIFQQFQLLPRMNAIQNVELPLIYAGVSKSKRKRRALEALKRVGLEDRKDHRPAELSGGQQQRVAIARALVTYPFVLLADEPTGALDSQSSNNVLDLFAELHQEGRTVVIITHDSEVAARAQRQIIIRDGEVIRDRPMDAKLGGGVE
jgi:putative ABC transport system ATP-binding protein